MDFVKNIKEHNRRHGSIMTAIIMAGALLLSSCGAGASGDKTEEAGAAPSAGYFSNFDMDTFDGEDTVTEEIFSDHALNMINIWATFCGPCVEEMPALQELSEEYADQGLQIIGLCSDVYSNGKLDERLMLSGQEILETTGAEYLQLVPNEATAEGLLSDVFAVPTTYFVDSEGNTVKIVIGAKSKEDWSTTIEELLSENQEAEESSDEEAAGEG